MYTKVIYNLNCSTFVEKFFYIMKKTIDSKKANSKKEFSPKNTAFKKDSNTYKASKPIDKGFKKPFAGKKSFDSKRDPNAPRYIDTSDTNKTRSNFTKKKDVSGEQKGYLGRKENYNPDFKATGARKDFSDKKDNFKSNTSRKVFNDKNDSVKSTNTRAPYTDKKEKYSASSTRNESREKKDSYNKEPKTDFKPKEFKSSTTRTPRVFAKKATDVSSIVPVKRAIEIEDNPNTMRLNRYLSMSGIASRRKADELIEAGKIKVNGKVVTEPGTKWNKGDVVIFEGKKLEPQQLVYILLNKPKNTIATNSDEKGRKTVFDHIDDKLAKLGLIDLRLFTVGRLDRNSLGVLLITNDGDLAQDLTHPSKEVEKIYQVQLDKNVSEEDMEKLATGITLEDGFIHCDKIAYVHELAKDEVGVEIHSGKNRIVRRMFEHLGYNVIKLDRVSFAGLTKKDLPRGKWRFLKEAEVRQLKHFNQPKNNKKK